MKYVIVFLLLILGPVVISAANYILGERRDNWQSADRVERGTLAGRLLNIRMRSSGLMLCGRPAGADLAVHSWILIKERGAPITPATTGTAWGEPIRVDGFAV